MMRTSLIQMLFDCRKRSRRLRTIVDKTLVKYTVDILLWTVNGDNERNDTEQHLRDIIVHSYDKTSNNPHDVLSVF